MAEFNLLTNTIVDVHGQLQHQAASAVNKLLTLRNWLIGFYIKEYQQKGSDRAAYGSGLLEKLSQELATKGLKNISPPELRRYRKFYEIYTSFILVFNQNELNIPIDKQLLPPFALNENTIRGTVSHDFKSDEKQIRGSVTHEFKNTEYKRLERLWTKLSFSHFSEILKLEEAEKRTFYQEHCIAGVWSVRELKRQIASLYYERSGGRDFGSLQTDQINATKLIDLDSVEKPQTSWLKNPMVFEFLGLPNKEVILEKELENALLDNLQHFLLELGNGFCFEARQKRIIIDDTYYFVDLVFYHRILKCHVLIELKAEQFTHENAGQLDVYLQYFKHEVMTPTDNPPIGILLCTEAKETMVKYATANKENLMVSEFEVALPSKEKLEAFLRQELNKNRI